MNLAVHCITCGGRKVLSAEHDSARELSTMLLAVHAAQPHQNHVIEGRVDDGPMPRGDHLVSIRCFHPECRNAGGVREITTAVVPLELVPAVVVVHHTSHEGHPIEVHVDGQSIVRSPAI